LTFEIAGRSGGATSRGAAAFTLTSRGYFDALKIPFVQGGSYTAQDESGSDVVVINETLAKRFWPDGNPLNEQIIIGDSPRRIIGIVGDVRVQALSRDPLPTVYLPSVTSSDQWWVIRTSVEPTSLRSAIQNALSEASGGLPVARVRTMREIVSRSTAADDFNALILTIFGGSALLLAAIGIYSSMAYSVTRRAQEIGIRLALGAASSQVRNSVMAQGMRLALAGIGCGLIAAIGLTRLMASLLFGVEAWDPSVFLGVPLVLAGVALAAAWFPARRASRVDPVVALRSS
jgi:predicted permease